MDFVGFCFEKSLNLNCALHALLPMMSVRWTVQYDLTSGIKHDEHV
jgi:hypothetical protein